MRIVITGGQGQLGRDFPPAFPGDEVTLLGRGELDVTSVDQISSMVTSLRPDVVINTAAFHRVDLCESEPEQSFGVNAAGPQRLASACESRGIVLVHFSTDYVFNGEKRTPYLESDRVDPISVYGASKAAGEMVIRATTTRHLIIRTTGLYGAGGLHTKQGNFVETMLRLAQRGGPITVVGDQVLTPTYTPDLAQAVAKLVKSGVHGTFHVTSGGACSWYEFAAEIFRQSGLEIDVIYTTQAERPVPARRPAYSVLGHAGLRDAGLPDMREWPDALRAYLALRRVV
ncbi:MAG: dTDP-4-dehydrorhamnose reductase [Chloroflexota bacterium]